MWCCSLFRFIKRVIGRTMKKLPMTQHVGEVPSDHPARKPERPSRGIAAARDCADALYCDLKMSTEQGLELLSLVTELRSSGRYPRLESVFNEIEQELGHSKAVPGWTPSGRR